MLLAPVSGLIIALSTSLQVTIFGFVTVPQTINDEIVHGYLRSLHGFSADVLLYLGSIHILAALYHHFWLKDRILDRMLK